MNFSNFDSLLEVAFALNVSYHLIPNLHNVGKKKINEIESKKITEWEAKVKELNKDEEKIEYNSYIKKIKSSSDESTIWKTISQSLSSYIATIFAILTMVALFLSAGEWKVLENMSLRVHVWIVIILLSPNIISIVFQLIHWRKIKKQLEYLIKKLDPQK